MESHTSFILSLWLTMLNTFKHISWPSEFLLLRTLFICIFLTVTFETCGQKDLNRVKAIYSSNKKLYIVWLQHINHSSTY